MPREDGFDITVASRDHGRALPGHDHHRPQGAPCAHRGGLHLRRRARHGRRPEGAGRHGGPAEGRAQAQPRADARGHARVRPRRPVRQHRARLQLRHRHAHGADARRLRASRRRASAPTWARRSSSTSSAAWRASRPTPWWWWPRCARSRYHGGVPKAELGDENLEALEAGLPNLLQPRGEHHAGISACPCVVAINRFPTRHRGGARRWSSGRCRELGVNVALSEVWAKGGEGGQALAERGRAPVRGRARPSFRFAYEPDEHRCAEDRGHRHARCTTPTACDFAPQRRQAAQAAGGRWASAACRCAWPRRSTRFSDDASEAGRARAASRVTVRNAEGLARARASWWR